MTEPLIPLEEPPAKPLTTWRVVLISAFVALVIGCLPALTTSLVVGDNLRATQQQIIEGRVHTTRVLCDRLNATITKQGFQTQYLENIIIEGAKSSKLFEKFYRQAGAPPYDTRVNQARKVAHNLGAKSPPLIDCKALVEEVRRAQ